MADFRLEAETRTEFGKGSARRTRRAGRVPAVLYGHGQDVVHLSLPAREFAAALRNGGTNVLLTVELDGTEHLALTKAIQRDPISRQYKHVDLLLVRRGEKVTVDDPWGNARSLEWATSCPPPRHNFVTIPRIRSERPAFDLHYPQVAGKADFHAAPE